MKLSKKTWFIVLPITGVILWSIFAVLIGNLVHSSHSRHATIQTIALAMKVYTYDHKTLPPLDAWCDKLISEAACGPRTFQGVTNPEKNTCGYALNENLKGLKFSELDDKVVLVFEAKGPWNLSGGPELMKKSKQKKIAVVFVDASVGYIKKEDVDKLKWKP